MNTRKTTLRDLGLHKLVLVVGSGRSGTTWIASILDTAPNVEYFYETTAFPGLSLDAAELLRLKYPHTYFLPVRPVLVRRWERQWLQRRARKGLREAAIGLRLFQPLFFPKRTCDTVMHKLVQPPKVVELLPELIRTFEHVKIVHVLRNPFAQIASECVQDAPRQTEAAAYFRQRLGEIRATPVFEPWRALAADALRSRDWLVHQATLWRIGNEALAKTTLAPRLELLYERATEAPTQTMEQCFHFLGWPLHRRAIRHIAATTQGGADDAALWSIHRDAAAARRRWRTALSHAEYETISSVLDGSPLVSRWDTAELAPHGEDGTDTREGAFRRMCAT